MRKLIIVIAKLAALDFALAPAERLGAFVVPYDEGLNGFTQLMFAFKTAAVECPSLKKTEHDFDLVQPTVLQSWRYLFLRPSLDLRVHAFGQGLSE